MRLVLIVGNRYYVYHGRKRIATLEPPPKHVVTATDIELARVYEWENEK